MSEGIFCLTCRLYPNDCKCETPNLSNVDDKRGSIKDAFLDPSLPGFTVNPRGKEKPSKLRRRLSRERLQPKRR